jgi:hemerythrin-like metal-binding protein
MAALINQLHTLMVIKRDRVTADQLTDLLIQATRSHFASEESLLSDQGFPECESHCQEHSKLIDELRDLQRQFKAGTISALAMPTFLRKWLLEHIEVYDRAYVEFLRAKGVR